MECSIERSFSLEIFSLRSKQDFSMLSLNNLFLLTTFGLWLLSTPSLNTSIFFYTHVYGTTYNHPIHTLPKATLLRSTSACWDRVSSKQPPFKRDLPSIYLILWLQQGLELLRFVVLGKNLVSQKLHKAGKPSKIFVKSPQNVHISKNPHILKIFELNSKLHNASRGRISLGLAVHIIG